MNNPKYTASERKLHEETLSKFLETKEAKRLIKKHNDNFSKNYHPNPADFDDDEDK